MRVTYTSALCTLLSLTTVETLLHLTKLNFIPTVFWWLVNTLIFCLFFLVKPYYTRYQEPKESYLVINLLLIWNIICIIRGTFVAEHYFEWKNLFYITFSLMLPMSVYIFSKKDFTQKFLSFWFKYMLFVFILLVPLFTGGNGFFGRYLTLFMILFLLFPLLPKNWKIITLVALLIVIIAGLDARSNIIRFGIATILGFLYYFVYFFRFNIIESLFKPIHFLLIITPIFLLVLGLTNTFNIFKIDEYIGGDYSVKTYDFETGESLNSSLTADTRTFIYKENITSAIKHNYIIEGRTPARGYDSAWFGEDIKFELGTDKEERFSSEVGILNFFTWNGLIGVFLYFLVFLTSSYLAIYKSNNYFIKVIGIFVAFRWAYSFVEDYSYFDLQYISLWIVISMCFSKEFREMSNQEFKQWVLGIFDKNKRRVN